MHIEELRTFLEGEGAESKFKSELSKYGEFILFSNSSPMGGGKYFALGINSFLTTIQNLIDNHHIFSAQQTYVEKVWRDNGSAYFTDIPANTLSTVQTKPLFIVLSRIIKWANLPQLAEIDTEAKIKIDLQSLHNTVDKLKEVYNDLSSDISFSTQPEDLLSFNDLRTFALKVFAHFYSSNWSGLLNGMSESDGTIKRTPYIKMSTPKLVSLIGKFDTEQNGASLTSSSTLRFFADPVHTEEGAYYYFSTQWHDDTKPGLSFDNLKEFIEEKHPGFEVSKSDEGLYILSGISVNQFPRNQILYGPPGTGKTHNAINHALAIIRNESLDELITSQYNNKGKRDADKKCFDKLLEEGRIQFVTYHQSYAYEDFVEGIRPVLNNDKKEPDSVPPANKAEANEIQYKIVDGVFKRICIDAELSNTTSAIYNGKKQPLTEKLFDTLYADYLGGLDDINSDLPGKELDTAGGHKKFNIFRSNYSIISKPKTGTSDFSTGVKALREWLRDDKCFYGCSYNPSIIGDFKSKYTIEKHEPTSQKLPYVLIIDEINRGNISKIFGELITLIEESKRLGQTEQLQVRLPYSGKLFGVPDNVYIIGTMNTADKSIALVDLALRRRFSFVAYYPNPKVIEPGFVDEINLRELLRIMNERICLLLDKDHQLGHTYFLGIKSKEDLCAVFRDKVIPLLQEYFNNDLARIAQVFGNTDNWMKNHDFWLITHSQMNVSTEYGLDNDEFADGGQTDIYGILTHLTNGEYAKIPEEAFISIYDKSVKSPTANNSPDQETTTTE